MTLDDLTDSIIQKRYEVPAERSTLVGISGIDAGGKGFISRRIAGELEQRGFRLALINADGWLNLPGVRFNPTNSGDHFYNHALRLDEMFERLIKPLKMKKSIDLTFDRAEETSKTFCPFRYEFENIDTILLEGIFIFKSAYAKLFDLKIWIECSFETALERAVHRSQEGLTPSETIAAYKSIHFPAQRVHFEKDDPRATADLTFINV